MPSIALVDDDRNILTTVAIFLRSEGFDVRTYPDGAAALFPLLDEPPDLAILDVKMPRMDGIELLRRLRQKSDLPVIFLTSKFDETDEVIGLRMGADDYVRKPFSQRLLVERVRAVLRRRAGAGHEEALAPPTPEPREQSLLRGSLMLDQARHRVTWKDQPINVTVTEFMILIALAGRPGVVKTRAQLLDEAYEADNFVDDRTIDSHIKRLRKKFRDIDPDFNSIETLYGAGYRFVEA